ncbi:hypothetical protein BgiMline_004308, partial [Biomphalaria glabrata]
RSECMALRRIELSLTWCTTNCRIDSESSAVSKRSTRTIDLQASCGGGSSLLITASALTHQGRS